MQVKQHQTWKNRLFGNWERNMSRLYIVTLLIQLVCRVHKKLKIVASGPITSWQIDGETMETIRDFIFFGSKITVNRDYNHEIKRLLPLGRKAMTNLDCILKNRDISLPTNFHIMKAMVFL